MSKGVIYILTNPSFPEYVKIGYAKDLEKRMNQLNRSETIPFAFRAYAVYEVESNLTDLVLHDLIDKLNPDLRSIENFDTYLLQMESFRVCGQDEYLCIPFVATILRLADIIDFDPKRTPSVLFSHLAVKNPVSLNEWKKHQSINAWTISPKRILFSAQCEHPAIEATILAFCNQIDEELRNGTVILSNLSDDGMGINMETYKIPLPPQVDRRKIQAKKDIISGKPIYRYHDTKFSLSKKQIIDLLMGTKLYGKPEVALRELLQNSIDACLLRQKLSELWGIEYTPKVKVSLYTKNNVDYLQVR